MKTMCPECDEISALENGIDDYGDDDGSSQKRIDELRAVVRSKGGALLD